MKKRSSRPARSVPSPSLPEHRHYAVLLSDIKDRIQRAQTRAVLAVNAELVRLYWDIGQLIDQRQRQEGWGAGVVPRLARDLRNELPDMKGFSERNIKRMLSFYREYPDPAGMEQWAAAQPPRPEKVPQPAAQLPASAKVPQVAAQMSESPLWSIPWFHHVILIEKVKDRPTRLWYMEQTLANGWSRNLLTLAIERLAHERHGKAVTNVARLLPRPQSDLIQQTLKDPYLFDFLTLEEPFHERELETQLVRHLEKFLLELGQGFAFVGRQYRLVVADEDFHIDLLFYHLRLRSFVVIDLKTGPFKPEYAGKLNFYCNVVNDQLRHPTDQPTIGLILCQTKDRVLAEYALTGIDKPIGVSSYELTRALPPSLKSALPTVEEIEAELAAVESAEAKPKGLPQKSAKKKRTMKHPSKEARADFAKKKPKTPRSKEER
ncbi:MAG: PDDEXK nuclease domain-containing protein [Thermoguttaceae bacterium]|jgi:predicted nuclease of restriction endonuclease-like (RecB) superfamily|nr:PDDEXK nuclease domain-containing protein [Thermoguttaceae bacterium]